MTEQSINSLCVDRYIWDVQRFLMKRFGVEVSERDVSPLQWYIQTGRAPSAFLKKLISAKPYMIARILHEGGSIQETVDRVKEYLGFDPCDY